MTDKTDKTKKIDKVDKQDNALKIDDSVIKTAKELAQEMFDLIGVTVELEVAHDKENDSVVIDIDSQESTGLLIGRRGETISALQYMLGIAIRQKLGGWARVILNIGDYREKQEEQLKDLAMTTADRARETNETQRLYNLNSAQRRIIHMVLSEEKDIITESEGEGRDRHLVVTIKDDKKGSDD